MAVSKTRQEWLNRSRAQKQNKARWPLAERLKWRARMVAAQQAKRAAGASWVRKPTSIPNNRDRQAALAVTREALCHERLRQARNERGHVPISLLPQIDQGTLFGFGLPGHRIRLRLPEAIDVWDLLRDVRHFLAAWRPERMRTPAELQAARSALALWRAQSLK